jgi:cell division protein FtsI (penicillin-binding protein 3)
LTVRPSVIWPSFTPAARKDRASRSGRSAATSAERPRLLGAKSVKRSEAKKTSGVSGRTGQGSDQKILTWRATAGRSQFVLGMLMLGLATVWGRSFYLQQVSVDQWEKRAANRFERAIVLPAPRGRILDRNGEVLAVSLSEHRVGLAPKVFDTKHPRLGQLAAILGIPLQDLQARVQGTTRFFYLASGLELTKADQIRALRIPGVELEQEFQRYYPHGAAFANLIGFTNSQDQGLEGLERQMEKTLRGTNGEERLVVDGRSQAFGQKTIKPAVPGEDIRLSFDAGIQAIAYQAAQEAWRQHQARSVSVVVVDSRTGELLALSNAPSFDPSQRGQLDATRVRNRAAADLFEPGSTMKPFVVAAALDAALFEPSTSISTGNGRMTIGRRTIRDTKAYDRLTVTEVVKKSSNVGMVQISRGLPSSVMYDAFASLGFGQATPLQFPAEASGRLRPWQSWQPIDKATLSYGYGLSASLLQMVQAYTVFARNGDRVDLRMTPVNGPVIGTPVFSAKTAAAVRDMLSQAAGPDGTGSRAQLEGFRVAGKTGTVHKSVAGGYAKDRYVGSFIGFAPAAAPRLVIGVVVDEPSKQGHYGGEVAAPVFARVAGDSLRRMQMSPDPAVRVQPTRVGQEEGLL